MADKNETTPMTSTDIVKSQANYKGNEHGDLVEIEIIKDTPYYKKGDKDVVHPATAEIFKAQGIIANIGKPFSRPKFDQKDVTIDV